VQVDASATGQCRERCTGAWWSEELRTGEDLEVVVALGGKEDAGRRWRGRSPGAAVAVDARMAILVSGGWNWGFPAGFARPFLPLAILASGGCLLQP